MMNNQYIKNVLDLFKKIYPRLEEIESELENLEIKDDNVYYLDSIRKIKKHFTKMKIALRPLES